MSPFWALEWHQFNEIDDSFNFVLDSVSLSYVSKAREHPFKMITGVNNAFANISNQNNRHLLLCDSLGGQEVEE